MKDHIFRMYDIRGEVGKDLDLDQVYQLGQAVAYYLLSKNPELKTIVIGMDGRVHSPIIKQSLVQSLQDSGLDVIFIGVCSTPVLYFALYRMTVGAGIMITASHNPKEYNGFKICLGQDPISSDQIQELKKIFQQNKKLISDMQGNYQEYDLIDEYIQWLVDHFAHLKGMALPVVFDCGNGATGAVLPSLVTAMGWSRVQLLYDQVDGTYPHHEADPIVEANMHDLKLMVKNSQAAVGIGFDGDGDRMAPVTSDGYLVPGDQLLALFAQQVLQQHPGMPVICDINASAGLAEYLTKLGSSLYLSPCGCAVIKDHMKRHKALLGGELSCHFIFNDRYFGFDDGIYAALRLLEIIIQSGQSLEQLLSQYPQKKSSPGIRIACEEDEKFSIVAAVKKAFEDRCDAHLTLVDGVRAQLPYGWGLIRVSNTQPVVTLRFEADNEQNLHHIKKDFYQILLPYFGASVLKAHFDLREDG